MSDQIIPLTNSPNQKLQVAVQVDGAILSLALAINYNEMAGYWVMGVSLPSGPLIIGGLPLLTGGWPAANILGQFQWLGIGSCYLINSGQSNSDYPDDTELGNDFFLLWGDSA